LQVKKDASMLEAFGKGASDDINNAKLTVYQVSQQWVYTTSAVCN
jgi:hypothetical protein